MFNHGMAIPSFRVNGGNAGRGGEANNLNELRGNAAVGRGGCRAASRDDSYVGCCAEEEHDGVEEEEDVEAGEMEDEAAEAEAAEAEAAEAEAAEAEAAEEEAAEAEAAEEEAAEAAAGTPASARALQARARRGLRRLLRPPGLSPRHVPTPYLPPCI